MARVPIGLDAVRGALPAGVALVSFVLYEGRVAPRGDGPGDGHQRSIAAFVMRAGAPGVTMVPLGPASAIDQRLDRWRAEAAGHTLLAGVPREEGDRALRLEGEHLRQAIWDPISAHVRGATTVFVVPDGTLALVPFGALPVGGDGFVIEHAPPIHYLSAERDVVRTSGSRSHGGGMLAMGGPAFDDAPASSQEARADAAELAPALRGGRACGSLQALRFERLDGTLEEVQDLARYWPPSLGDVRTLVGREAGERAFKAAAAHHRVLHLATHGFFLDGSCLPDAVASSTRGVGGLASARPIENPLRVSGLALAGANRRAQTRAGEEDGILTAEEVAMLDLQGVEWAVLSACDTGVGEIKAGEGVFGLRRAFQVAGARTVIMSLWSVEDQATRAWMRALYEGRFQRKLSTADAVHQASLAMLRDRRARGLSTHPFYWAAFVAAGDWR
jgi:CHAT domain-containing protein